MTDTHFFKQIPPQVESPLGGIISDLQRLGKKADLKTKNDWIARLQELNTVERDYNLSNKVTVLNEIKQELASALVEDDSVKLIKKIEKLIYDIAVEDLNFEIIQWFRNKNFALSLSSNIPLDSVDADTKKQMKLLRSLGKQGLETLQNSILIKIEKLKGTSTERSRIVIFHTIQEALNECLTDLGHNDDNIEGAGYSQVQRALNNLKNALGITNLQ